MIDFQVPNEARSVLHTRDSPEEHVLETREYFMKVAKERLIILYILQNAFRPRFLVALIFEK